MKTQLKTILAYSPLILLIFAAGYTIYTLNTTNIAMVDRHYMGMAFIVAACIAAIKKPQLEKAITQTALILGTLNFLAFTPVIQTYNVGFSVNGVGPDIRLQSFSFLVLILFVIINFRLIIRGVKRVFK